MALTLGIAGLDIALPKPTPFQLRVASAYPSYGKCEPDITVCVTDEEVRQEDAFNTIHDLNYLRDVCTYRRICEQLDAFDAFLLHAATVAVNGSAYAFCARSGTGKSTHISLWRQEFHDSVNIVNGDKPIIRFFDGVATACGTPWAGKEGWNQNVSVPLKAICFLERSAQNEIVPLDKGDAVHLIMQQILRAKSASGFARQCDLLNRTLAQVDVWHLKCNISPKAAQLSFETMTKTTRSE